MLFLSDNYFTLAHSPISCGDIMLVYADYFGVCFCCSLALGHTLIMDHLHSSLWCHSKIVNGVYISTIAFPDLIFNLLIALPFTLLYSECFFLCNTTICYVLADTQLHPVLWSY